jgi:hypothetical protein
MSYSIKVLAGAFLILLLLRAPLGAYDSPETPAPRPFNYATDTFSFANETVWNYVDGSVQSDAPGSEARKRDYTRRCFVVTRAAVQFWKFAKFDPGAAPLPPDQLADRIRQVTSRSVWLPPLPPGQRIAFPGFSSLRDISAADPSIFQANIGLGWPVYFRAGNMPIVVPIGRDTESELNNEIFRDLQMNYPTVVWLYNFPSLNINHVLVIIAGKHEEHKFHYKVYDPNYASGPRNLEYDEASRTFSYQPTFYFRGGPVEARAIYRGVLQ